MKNILILGAGFSSSSLIKYLLDHSHHYQWKITIADIDKELILRKTENHPNSQAVYLDGNDADGRKKIIAQNDVIISMLPARMHPQVAKDCLELNKHMLTASYVSEEMKAMHQEALNKGLLFLNEIGVDPGIDHMSAMKVIHNIQAQGGKMLAFESSTGGLIAPPYDNNPWRYKFTWNPRNVILAGQGTSRYIENGRYKYIPYHRLFTSAKKTTVLNYGEFEVYANRDSLKYRYIYGLDNIPTMFRGTMRRAGYCQAWNVFVQLGLTDDTYVIENSENITWRQLLESFLPENPSLSVEENLAKFMGFDIHSEPMNKIQSTGIFSEVKTGLPNATPAQLLQHLLEPRWKLEHGDLDMIVMQHRFVYEINGQIKKLKSSLVTLGKDTTHTAMSITVGIPLAIATKLLMTGKISERGVVIPIIPSIYEAVLDELKEYGITFIEEYE